MNMHRTRRQFLKDLGLASATLPFIANLPSLAAISPGARKQRLVIIFSPDGVVPSTFWPDETGSDFKLKESLKPFEPFKDKTLILHGVCDKIRGDGDGAGKLHGRTGRQTHPCRHHAAISRSWRHHTRTSGQRRAGAGNTGGDRNDHRLLPAPLSAGRRRHAGFRRKPARRGCSAPARSRAGCGVGRSTRARG